MNEKHVICAVDDVHEGTPVIAQLRDRISVGVYRIEGAYYAYRNHCPHAGAPVCMGVLGGAIVATGGFGRALMHEGRVLKCPWHAWEFLLPEGVTLTDPPLRLTRFPVAIEDGQVVVELPPRRARA